MYSRQEASEIRKKFWTSFGQYLSPIPSASGEKINWINYKTGIRFIHFKADVSNEAYIGIEITHDHFGERRIYFEQFRKLKTSLEDALGEKWVWEEHSGSDEDAISRIYASMENVNIYNIADWPAIISFLKERMLNLDRFWNEYKIAFEMIK